MLRLPHCLAGVFFFGITQLAAAGESRASAPAACQGTCTAQAQASPADSLKNGTVTPVRFTTLRLGADGKARVHSTSAAQAGTVRTSAAAYTTTSGVVFVTTVGVYDAAGNLMDVKTFETRDPAGRTDE